MVANQVWCLVDPERPRPRMVPVDGQQPPVALSTRPGGTERPTAGGLLFHCGAQPVWTRMHSNRAALIKSMLLIIAIRHHSYYHNHGNCHSRRLCCFLRYSYRLKGVDPCRPPPRQLKNITIIATTISMRVIFNAGWNVSEMRR